MRRTMSASAGCGCLAEAPLGVGGERVVVDRDRGESEVVAAQADGRVLTSFCRRIHASF
jgi:predicted RNA methylase